MTRILRISAAFLFALVTAVSTSAQQRPLVGTVADVDAGKGRLQIETDEPGAPHVTVETDTVATTWHGFGTMINGKPEIFTGSSGFANVRVGDRVDVRGTLLSEGIVRAGQVTLLGREVSAPQVGVGQTRTPTSVATPTQEQARAASAASVEGTVRQVNADEGRIVIQTAQRRMVTVSAFRSTPVWYRGEEYRIANLETGDRIRVEIDPRDVQADEIVARRIDVTQSAGETGANPSAARVMNLEGRVVRTEPGLDYAYVNDGRAEIRVDMSRAEDATGEAMHARDLRADDRVTISGSYNRAGDMFLASTVRFGNGAAGATGPERFVRYAVVTITGTVVETLEDAATISVRDRDSGQVARVWAVGDLVVRNRANGTTTAELLRVDDTVVVQAFRDAQGNLIAQTIRLRNR